MWIEIDHYIAPLYAFLRQGRMGGARGDDVYIVRDEHRAIYVGKTRKGVYYRLWQHAKTESNLGLWLVEHEFDPGVPSYSVEVIGVDGDIDEAEQHTIASRSPVLNVVNYKNKLAMPPRVKQPIDEIDLSDYPAYTSTIFVKPEYASYYSEAYYKITDRGDYEAMDRLVAGLYSRAYRDPNHPDLRKMEVLERTSTTKDVFYYLRTRNLL